MARAGFTVKNTGNKKRNLFINSDMKYSQRGSSATPGGGSSYLLDRFVGWITNPGSVTGETMSQSSQPASFPGDARVLEVDRAFRMYGTPTDGTPSFNRRQRIESIRLPETNVVSFGCWVWASTMQDVSIQILQPTTGNPDDWASSSVIADNLSIPITDSAWQFIKLENVTLANRDGLEIRVVMGNPSSFVFADTYTTQWMCNEGPELAPWELMAEDSSEEELLCLRYYLRGQYATVTNGRITITFPTRMRTGSGVLTYPTTGGVVLSTDSLSRDRLALTKDGNNNTFTYVVDDEL